MKKAFYSILVGALTTLMLVSVPSSASAALYTEGFDSPSLVGWTAKNNSAPVGSTTVYMGDTTVFPAHQGAATSYVAMNYNSTGNTGTISTWFITPKYSTLSNGDVWSFFTRTHGEPYADRLEFRMSTNGNCDPGTGVDSTGDFTTLLHTVNPGLAATGYPAVWTQMTGALTGIRGAKSGCFAFRYSVPNAGFNGLNSNYIGLDTYSYDDQPTDVAAPDTTIVAGPDGDTNDATPTFQFNSTEAGSTFECALDEAEFSHCAGPDGSYTAATIGDGSHALAVRAVDAAGNADDSPATRSFAVDTTAPETTIVSATGGGITNDTTPTFGFESSEAASTFECALDGAHFGPCSGPGATHTTDPLGEGSYAFAVRATDALGNTDDSPAQHALSIDSTAPETTIVSGPDGTTNDASPTFELESSEPGSTFECSIDEAAFSACSGPGATHTTDVLDDGEHTMATRSVDVAGNADDSPATRTFTVDATGPETEFVSGPDGDTNDTTPTFGFESSEAGSTFECSIDEAAFSACSGPDATHTTDALDDGGHAIAVRATDVLGNVGESTTQAFTIDTVAPDTSIVFGPDGDTNDTTPEFQIKSTEPGATFECAVDEAEFTSCSDVSSLYTTGVLTDGEHTIHVRSTDRAGNTDGSPATRTVRVDATAPETSIVSGPDGDTDDSTPRFGFESSEDGSTFECSIDEAEFAPCDGPAGFHTAASLGDGEHLFAVRATDTLGNVDASPATRTFTVDTTAPDTTIVSGPEGETDDTTPTFGFESTESGSTFECSLDEAQFSACAGSDGTYTTPVLDPGAHTIAVRAIDALDHTDATPATRAFTVVAAPVVTPAPKDCSADHAAVAKAKTALTKANKAVTSANKKVKSAKKALKSAKKHGSKKAVTKAKKKLTKANKAAKKAKASVKTLKKRLATANGKLATCQRT